VPLPPAGAAPPRRPAHKGEGGGGGRAIVNSGGRQADFQIQVFSVFVGTLTPVTWKCALLCDNGGLFLGVHSHWSLHKLRVKSRIFQGEYSLVPEHWLRWLMLLAIRLEGLRLHPSGFCFSSALHSLKGLLRRLT
jgi:hypothetical protein